MVEVEVLDVLVVKLSVVDVEVEVLEVLVETVVEVLDDVEVVVPPESHSKIMSST